MSSIGKFLTDKRGTVAMLFAAMLVPIVAFAGAAVDYARTLKIRTVMQAAADAASMAAATASAPTTQHRVLIAQQVFAANAKLSQFGLDATPSVTVTPGNVQVSANVSVPTVFMKMVSIESMPVRVRSGVATAGKTLELAMMLDVTGSMQGQKIADMKWAAKDFMDIVMPEGGGNSPTKIALVPFSNRVNAGDFAAAVTGLSATRTTTRGRGWRRRTQTDHLITCVTERQGYDRYTDEAPEAGSYVGPVNPGSSTSSQYSGSGGCSIPEVRPLSNDRDDLRDHIDSFTAAGGTAGHLGTAWAWYMLSPKWNSIWPGHHAREYGEGTNIKAAVLMTDGAYNTDYSSGYSSTTMARELCERMKAEGIVVYTVGFQIPNNSTQRDTLVQCASSENHYFFPYNGDDLRAAFRSIGQALTYAQGSARLSH